MAKKIYTIMVKKMVKVIEPAGFSNPARFFFSLISILEKTPVGFYKKIARCIAFHARKRLGSNYNNAGDKMTLTLYNVTLTSQKPC